MLNWKLGALVLVLNLSTAVQADLIEVGSAGATQAVALGHDPSDGQTVWAVRAQDDSQQGETGWQGVMLSTMGKSHLGGTLAVGWVIGKGNALDDVLSYRRGFLVEGQVGTDSMQLSVGRIRENFIVVFPVGTDIKLSYLHTQGQTTWDGNQLARDYLGFEADLYLFFMKMGAGVFRSVDWDQSGVRNWLGILSAGVGF